jgi:hypothetical protein
LQHQPGRIGVAPAEVRVQAGAAGLHRFEFDALLLEGVVAAEREQRRDRAQRQRPRAELVCSRCSAAACRFAAR